jgi:hypothetical protein
MVLILWSLAMVGQVRGQYMYTVPRSAALTCLAARTAVVWRADALVRLSAVTSVQTSGFARHPLAATAEIPRRTVTGSPLEVTHAAILTGARLAGCCNNVRCYRSNGNTRRQNMAFIVRIVVHRMKEVKLEHEGRE